MNAFVDSFGSQLKRTANGMAALSGTSNPLVDLFFKIGASRGKNILGDFIKAFNYDADKAIRIALWARDVRAGAGERKIFRDILNYLATNRPNSYAEILYAHAILKKIPELGRWDDFLAIENTDIRQHGYSFIKEALDNKNGLCAKWMDRKGQFAIELRRYLGLTPKQYRKMLVELTKVVETQMCAKDWDSIDFNHVPSVASSRYKKAFNRNTMNYAKWATTLEKNDGSAKVNAAAVYPYDVLKNISNMSASEQKVIIAQWNALPNYVGDNNILPTVDVSGSMTSRVGGGNSTLTCMDVAVSLGLYLSDKNKGAFKNCFLTFSDETTLEKLKGNIIQQMNQMKKSHWTMNTNLHRAFDTILDVAVTNEVPQEDMPKVVLILSDMQFDSCASYDDSAIKMIRRKYEKAGYQIPIVVFWNLNSSDNVPVKFNEKGVALISGFSPTIVKSVLDADLDNLTPDGIMLKTIMNFRYDF